MPPRHTVEQLPDEQFQFVINAIIDGKTDREISASFQAEFKTKLSKSALGRWREVTGDELAERYRITRFQATQLLEDLKLEDADKFQVVIDNIEDRLLTATKEIISQDPIKLLGIQQEEKRRALKLREIELKERALELETERVHGVALDRAKLGEEYAADLLEYIGEDADGLRWFQRHAQAFQEFIKKKYQTEAS